PLQRRYRCWRQRHRARRRGGERLERSARTGGVASLVLRIQPTEQLPGTLINEMNDRQIPARVAHHELAQMAVAVRDLKASRADDDGAVAHTLSTSFGTGEGSAKGGAVGGGSQNFGAGEEACERSCA